MLVRPKGVGKEYANIKQKNILEMLMLSNTIAKQCF